MTTVASLLANAARDIPISETRLLLGAAMKQSTVWLLTHGDAALDVAQSSIFTALLDRRLGGEPLAYLLGYREFYGRDFFVSPAVLIPRPETEMLVDLVKSSVGASVGADNTPSSVTSKIDTPSILDLGTGSGCIAISIALLYPQHQVTAVDASIAALQVAIANAKQLQANVEFILSDWYAKLSGRRFNIIVSNPPYIAFGDAHLQQGDLRFEPSQALSSGQSGLAALRNIIQAAPRYLHPQGMLAVEHGYDQASAVRELFARSGFCDIAQHPDLAGIVRVSCGRLAAMPVTVPSATAR